MLKAAVVIPTYNGENELRVLLPKVLESFSKTEVLVIDSSSEDATCLVANSFGVKVEVISKKEFNHGLTREKARKILDRDIVIYLTQDALPLGKDSFKKLIEPLIEGKALLSYGRQVPKEEAHPFEKCLRNFNYPEKGEIRTSNDYSKKGASTYFCSNVFAAYLNSALDSVGGFSQVCFGEDTLVAAKILQKGGSIAYVADALVVHSHKFSLWNEFKRYRAMGRERRLYPEFFGKGDKSRGVAFAKELFKQTTLIHWPYAFVYLAVKGLGFFARF